MLFVHLVLQILGDLATFDAKQLQFVAAVIHWDDDGSIVVGRWQETRD